jgi:hypoxanthine phosphoribosyltransferase
MTNKLDKRIKRLLILENEINDRCQSLADRINKDYKGKNPIIVGVLKGCLPFYNNLFLRLTCEPVMDFMIISSYSGTKQMGIPKIVADLRQNITDRHVIIVEDIVDTGRTLSKVIALLKLRNPKSIKIACLVDKYEARKVSLKPEYVCFPMPNV